MIKTGGITKEGCGGCSRNGGRKRREVQKGTEWKEWKVGEKGGSSTRKAVVVVQGTKVGKRREVWKGKERRKGTQEKKGGGKGIQGTLFK